MPVVQTDRAFVNQAKENKRKFENKIETKCAHSPAG